MKSMNRREFLKVATGLTSASLGAAVLSSCAPAPAAAPGAAAPAAAPAAAEKVSVRFATWFSGANREKIDEMVKEFTVANPGIEIIHEPSPGGMPFHEKMMTAVTSGDPPDIFRMWGGTLAKTFIVSDNVLPLDEEYPKHNWNEIISSWAKDASMRDGKVWGLPVAARGMWPTYRKDLFEQVGITAPKTYEEVEANNQKLKAAGIAPVTLGGKNAFYHFMRWLDVFMETTCGPELHDQVKNLQASWDSPEVVEAFTILKKWVDEEWFIPNFMGVEPPDARLPLYQGKAAMILENDAIETTMAGDGQDTSNYDFFPFPTGHTPLRVSGYPEMILLWKGTKVKDQAIKFMDWFVQPEQQNKWYGALGATATIGVGPAEVDEWPLTVKNRKFMDELEAVFPPADQALETELMGNFSEIQVGIITGSTSAEQAAKDMQAAAETWLAKQQS